MGPILAYCGKVGGEVEDMDMSSYTHMYQYLIYARRDLFERVRVVGPKVQAVKVLCDGELQKDGGQRLQTFTAPRFHFQSQTDGELSSISKVSFSCALWRGHV